MSDETGGRLKGGRPRLPDLTQPLAPLRSRTPARDLSPDELEARRYNDRMKMRRYRDASRRTRSNPQNLPKGVDGLQTIHDAIAEAKAAQARAEAELAEARAAQRRAEADFAVIHQLRSDDQRRIVALERENTMLRRAA